MLETGLKLLPIVVMFWLGFMGRRYGYLDARHAGQFLRLVANLGLPCLIIAAFSRIEFKPVYISLPFYAMATVMLMWPAAWLTGRSLRMPVRTLGTFIVGAMILNLAFITPYIITVWGSHGFIHIALFDFGHSIIVLTLVSAIACRYGHDRARWLYMLRRIVTFPPFLALFYVILSRQLGLVLPAPVLEGAYWLGYLVMLLVVVAMGIYLDLQRLWNRQVMAILLLKPGLGMLIGLGMVGLFRLDGMIKTTVILGCMAPVGFNTLIYAQREKLDTEFAAHIASLTVLLGLLYVPLLIFILY